MKTAKQEAMELLEDLPDDVPMDTLLTQLHFKASVLRALEEAEHGEGLSHEEVKARLSAWRKSPGRAKLSEM